MIEEGKRSNNIYPFIYINNGGGRFRTPVRKKIKNISAHNHQTEYLEEFVFCALILA
jgi:hypothetical protein